MHLTKPNFIDTCFATNEYVSHSETITEEVPKVS